jgi:hypothetical protein
MSLGNYLLSSIIILLEYNIYLESKGAEVYLRGTWPLLQITITSLWNSMTLGCVSDIFFWAFWSVKNKGIEIINFKTYAEKVIYVISIISVNVLKENIIPHLVTKSSIIEITELVGNVSVIEICIFHVLSTHSLYKVSSKM